MNRPALNDKQLTRMAYRIGLFMRRGLTERAAELLADRLADRDHDRDDRKVCLECAHLQHGGTCFAASQGWIRNTNTRFTPVQDLLQRCEAFSWSMP